jgi:uncharacterized DUF497 family protein
MNSLKFEWDFPKASANIIKHGISFDEAKTVFDDDFARLIPDLQIIQRLRSGSSCLG